MIQSSVSWFLKVIFRLVWVRNLGGTGDMMCGKGKGAVEGG